MYELEGMDERGRPLALGNSFMDFCCCSFFAALIPNYFMAKAGWKEGEM
jgi:hypothetical protein